jgi:hypothetical protein
MFTLTSAVAVDQIGSPGPLGQHLRRLLEKARFSV